MMWLVTNVDYSTQFAPVVQEVLGAVYQILPIAVGVFAVLWALGVAVRVFSELANERTLVMDGVVGIGDLEQEFIDGNITHDEYQAYVDFEYWDEEEDFNNA